ncbi:MAG: PIN domain-containing protein [Dialister hominis]|uniref:PIN/TRAM domain-containing protein n=1 Tax=Dialister hominis TaxID=2582419 RepID=UPI002EB2BC64|nr:PIN domain-containing protein [Dialister hominis]
MPEKILRAIFVLLFTVLGIVLSRQGETVLALLLPNSVLTETILGITFMSLAAMLVGGIFGAIIGSFISPYLIKSLFMFTSTVEKSLSAMSTQDLIAGTLGLFLGLIIANLVGLAFGSVPYIGPYVSVALSIILGYLGMHLVLSKKSELAGWLHLHAEGSFDKKKNKDHHTGKLLDTNVIIDGRVADIYRSGFLEGPIIVPVFVLEELQKIADSSDILKRNRGRRGLDILNHMRKNSKDDVIIVTNDFEDISEVDSKLVKLAREKNYKIVTNDYNLNKVAELQGVAVLNINDLAIAVKPAVIPGEQIFVQLVKSGKEEGQGVAYLEDGTMIVVENGSQCIGKEVPVIITSVLQTSAGKMIFAKLESDE